MNVCCVALRIYEVTVHPRLVNPVELALVAKQVRLTKRPCLCHSQTVQLVANLDQFVVLFLEPFVDLSLSATYQHRILLCHPPYIPLQHNLGPEPTPLHQQLDVFLSTGKRHPFSINELSVLHALLNLLQLGPKRGDLG